MNEMPKTLKLSSDGRFWTGFNAEVLDTFGGAMEVVPNAYHHLSMHLGQPVRALCRCDGRWHRRLQSRGDIDIVPMGCPVRWEDDGPTRVLSITLRPSLLHSAAEGMGLQADRIALAPQVQVQDAHLQHICWAIVAELEDGDPSYRLHAESLGLALASHLVRRYAPRAARKSGPRLSKRQLQSVMDYIGENLAQNVSLFDLATVAGVSASHFKALFKESVGVPVHQYVIQRRVDLAVQLLTRGVPAKQVAAHAGFAHQSHMARCMRRVLGVTPKAVRF
jgi:AraC family transcriptional regulator